MKKGNRWVLKVKKVWESEGNLVCAADGVGGPGIHPFRSMLKALRRSCRRDACSEERCLVVGRAVSRV